MTRHTAEQIIQSAGDKDALIFDYDSTLARVPIDWPAMRVGFRNHMGDLCDEFGLHQVERVDEMEHAVLSVRPDLAEMVFSFRRKVEQALLGAHEPIAKSCQLVLQIRQHSAVPMHIISNNLRETVAAGLRQIGLDHCFSQLIGVDDVGLPKPDPRALTLLRERQELDPGRCLFIGDNDRTDGQFCRNVGIPFIHLDEIRFD